MTPLFIVTSAINSRFGIYTPEERMGQTLETIRSIRTHSPLAKIALAEMAGVELTNNQYELLLENTDYMFDYTTDHDVQDIYDSTDNWDIVKNTTEVMCFAKVLHSLFDIGAIDHYTRIFKISGRYVLNEKFEQVPYDEVPNNIVILERNRSQFPLEVTGGMKSQYMSRLWSWPADSTEDILEAYEEGFLAMAQRLSEGGYFDIEHMLFKFLPRDTIIEIPVIGLSGLLGPNGAKIED